MLKKIDPTVKRETCYIACWVLVLSLLMQAVFLIISAWDPTVLWGNLLGAFAALLNFFLMGLTVQSAVKKEPADAKKQVSASQQMRMLMLLGFCVIGASISCFNLFAVVIPLVFPRIGVAFRPLFKNMD